MNEWVQNIPRLGPFFLNMTMKKKLEDINQQRNWRILTNKEIGGY